MTHEEYEQLIAVVNKAKMEIIKGNFEFGSVAYEITAHINRLIDITVKGFISVDYPIDSMVKRLDDTDNGKQALGIDSTPTEYSVSAGTEETMGWQETERRTGAGYTVRDDEWKHSLIGIHGNVLRIWEGYDAANTDVREIAKLLNTETRTLRSENARLQRELEAAKALYDGKHERLEELKRELEVSREARKILAKQINDAAHYLGLSEDNDENSNRAYNILQGYTTTDS